MEEKVEIVQSKKKITYHLVVLVLILNLIITSSFAWLVSNRTATISEAGMALEVDDTSAVYRAYVYDLDKNKGTNQKSDKTIIDVTNLDLNQYDMLFRARNKYTPAFAQIKILGNVSMPDSGTLHVTIDCLTEGIDTSKYEYTSNIARFTAFIIPGDGNPNTLPPDVIAGTPANPNDEESVAQAADTLYKFINTEERYKAVELYRGNGRADSKTFVTLTGDENNYTHSKANSVTISVNYTANDWYTDESNQKSLNIYLYITYDVQLIDYYFGEIFSDVLLNLDSAGIKFANDLKKITISYDK